MTEASGIREQCMKDIARAKSTGVRLSESLNVALWMIGLVYDRDDIIADERIQRLTHGLREVLSRVNYDAMLELQSSGSSPSR